MSLDDLPASDQIERKEMFAFLKKKNVFGENFTILLRIIYACVPNSLSWITMTDPPWAFTHRRTRLVRPSVFFRSSSQMRGRSLNHQSKVWHIWPCLSLFLMALTVSLLSFYWSFCKSTDLYPQKARATFLQLNIWIWLVSLSHDRCMETHPSSLIGRVNVHKMSVLPEFV